MTNIYSDGQTEEKMIIFINMCLENWKVSMLIPPKFIVNLIRKNGDNKSHTILFSVYI